jgi:Holliday junction resolvase RusA-like endonuclease
MIHLHVDCVPTSWSAAQKGSNGFYDKKAKEKEFVKWQLKGQYRDSPLEGHVSLDFIFFIPIPKSASKAMRKQMLDRRVLPTSPDTTNMQKLYEDCLQGIVIDNDRYASKVSSTRYYSDKPGVWIVVRRWEEETHIPQQAPQQHWLKV